jgi:hypothetical protein
VSLPFSSSTLQGYLQDTTLLSDSRIDNYAMMNMLCRFMRSMAILQ